MNERLARLAMAAGIEPGYRDALDTWRELEAPTARAILRALALDPDGDIEAQIARLVAPDWADRGLPPFVLAHSDGDDGASVSIGITIPEVWRARPLQWECRFESGEHVRGEIVTTGHDLAWDEITTQLPDPARVEMATPLPDPARAEIRFDAPLGYHRISFPELDASTTLIVAPRRCFIPEALARHGRIWGIAIQLYSLRSDRNWGIGDFTDLAGLAAIAGSLGAAVIGLNPLHVRHLARPDEASPYAPSSRLFLDPMYIDVEAVPGFADYRSAIAAAGDSDLRQRLKGARVQPFVDHPLTCALKLPVLRQLFDAYRVRHAGPADPVRYAFELFKTRHGAVLSRFTEFEALRLLRALDGEVVTDWQEWPSAWRDPASVALERFRGDHADAIEFQAWLQWEAARQLERAANAARQAGLALVLYRDLAVGAARDSAEAWGDPTLIAQGVSVGAPPDEFNRAGQNWGLPPWNPRELEARAFEPFAALLAANMAGAGALRIDHVMALLRLFWIPDGMRGTQGAYVRQPFETLAAIVALESVRNRCIVIGEDLGSVPEGSRERLHELAVLSYRVLLFERHWQGDGRFKRPEEYPWQALATVVTHDMPTIADWWRRGDIARRAELGMFADDGAREQEVARRDDERRMVLALLDDLGLTPADPENTDQIAEALHAVAARTPSMLAMVQLDDVLGETLPANIPGTNREYPNWRRKLALTLGQIAMDPRLGRLAAIMREAGRV